MSDTLIKVEGLYKKFCRSLKRSMVYGTVDSARTMLGIRSENTDLRVSEFWALEDINFELKKGETLGLIGQNGCGKSTLLRLINGIFPPDRGSITINGRIGALIAVGAGFHPHMTGRENIFLNGTILGMSKQEIRKKFDSIVDFAEIGEFLDAPVATYSSGMHVRLGFAIAIHGDPDILLVDEILAVGDARFQRKCLNKIKEMQEKETAFILVSHNMQNIEAMCRNSLLLDHGKQIDFGDTRRIIPSYEVFLQSGKFLNQLEKSELVLTGEHKQSGEVTIEGINILDDTGKERNSFKYRENIVLTFDLDCRVNLGECIIYCAFRYINNREDENKNFECMSYKDVIHLEQGKQTIRLRYEDIRLTTGEYRINFYIHDHNYVLPYAHGFFDSFFIEHKYPNINFVGTWSPVVWAEPEISISRREDN